MLFSINYCILMIIEFFYFDFFVRFVQFQQYFSCLPVPAHMGKQCTVSQVSHI